jgi:hypothetical protein
MKFIRRSCGAVLFGALIVIPAVSGMASAAETVSAGNAWVRTPAPGQKTAAAYLDLTSDGDAALVAAESPAAGKAELHTMNMDGGVMRMRPVQKIDLPALKTVKLAPGGLHIMLLDIKRPLKEGDTVPLVLKFQGKGKVPSTVKVEAQVRAMGAASMHNH